MHRTLEIIDRHLETLTTMMEAPAPYVTPYVSWGRYAFARGVIEGIKKEIQELQELRDKE